MENFDYIDDYLRNALSKEDRSRFEERLNSDLKFKDEFEYQKREQDALEKLAKHELIRNINQKERGRRQKKRRVTTKDESESEDDKPTEVEWMNVNKTSTKGIMFGLGSKKGCRYHR